MIRCNHCGKKATIHWGAIITRTDDEEMDHLIKSGVDIFSPKGNEKNFWKKKALPLSVVRCRIKEHMYCDECAFLEWMTI